MDTEPQASETEPSSPEPSVAEPVAPATVPARTPAPSGSGARASLVALVVALALPGGTAALWIAPRPAQPAEMPPLVVPQLRADATIARLASVAEAAPGDDDATEARRRELYLAHGLAEARPNAAPGEARLRDQELFDLAASLEADGSLESVRARDVVRTIEALGRGGQDDARVGEIGALPRALVEWGAVHDGRRIAPRVVVYALALARWNGIHRRPLTEGMDETMLLAYHGWLVYYGPVGGTELRDGALVDYVAAGGRRGLETEAFLRLSRGDATGAQLAFEAAYEASGNVRLRNHALALGLQSLEPDEARPVDEGG